MQVIRAFVAAAVRRDLRESQWHQSKGPARKGSISDGAVSTQDEIRERKLREAQETRERLRSSNQQQQVAGEE